MSSAARGGPGGSHTTSLWGRPPGRGTRGLRNKVAGSPPVFVFVLALAFVIITVLPAQGDSRADPLSPQDLNTVYARDEFRIGVQAYNRYGFNEAIQSFERALSYRPGEALLLDWLGRAYYRSGFEDTAVRQWQAAAEAYGYSTGEALLLGSRIETVRNRRGLEPVALGGSGPLENDRYVEAGRYPGRGEGVVYYKQPTSVLPLEDGSVWVAAYGSNELVRIDVNGVIRDRWRGPVNGFDRPYDIARGLGGIFYVSEYRGGRVSVLSPEGEWQYYIGSRGLGPGQFVGPQNIAVDEDGYLYVVDYGNKRVSKFGPEGAFIQSFGLKSAFFRGFLSPTGIAARGGRVYVADSVSKEIVMFDSNGEYLGPLVREGLQGPESLRFLDNGMLLAADLNRALLIDPDTAIVRELGVLGKGGKARITGVGLDRNGSLLAADFKTGEVAVMTRMEDMASGLFVQIERVISDGFPLVTVELQVQDRRRRPIVGLEARNFLLSEGVSSVPVQEFQGAAYLTDQVDMAVLVERSPETAALKDELAAALRDIDASGNRIARVVSASEAPALEEFNPGAPRSLESAARGRAAAYTPRWRFDLGLRLAASGLFAGAKKRAVVFVCSGGLGELAFEQYSLSELAAFLANNDTAFYAVLVGGLPADAGLRFLCEQTGGEALPLYRGEGVSGALRAIARRPSGSYTISFRSALSTDFGRAFLPLDAEVYLMDRSGRDSTGYFPPLE